MLKRGTNLALFLFIAFSFFLTITPARSENKVVFEQDFSISVWRLHLSYTKFDHENSGSGLITLEKTSPDKQINGGFVLINNKFIFLQTFFTGNELVFEEDINLQSTNHLTVFLRGTPGASVSVNVSEQTIQPSSPKILFFTAEPSSIKTGDSSTLNWQTENAELCVIDPDVGQVDSSGAFSVSPTSATTYILTASGGGDTVSSEVTIAIDNTAPLAESQILITDEDKPVVVLLSGSDADGDSLSYEVLSGPHNGALQGTPPNLTYIPVADFNGEDEFTFSSNDGRVNSEPATVLIAVAAVNDAPISSAGAEQELFVGEIVQLDGRSSEDVDGDPLTYKWTFLTVPQGSNAALSDASSAEPTFAPDVSGVYEVQLIVNDGTVDSYPDVTTITANPRMVQIPDVVGLSQTDAQTAITGANLTVGPIITAYSGTVEAEHVISQNPEAGTSAPEGSAVDLVVSLGPVMVIVPGIVGQPQVDAAAAITGANLTVGAISTANNNTVPADYVISQSPAGGASVPEGSAVDFVISLGPAQPPTVSISAAPATIAQGETATLSWISTDAQSAHIDNGIGLVNPNGSLFVAPEHTTTYTIAVVGETGSSSGRVTVKVTGSPLPQPEGSFGENYEDLIPQDATVDQYDPKRFALITGRVQNSAGAAISDVSITVLSHPEYGTATTDAQGEFSIPVEGGGILTVVYRRNGLISAQRKAHVPWNDTVRVETVVLIAQDSASTTMTFDGNADTVMTHTSTQVEDEYGIRSTTIVVHGDNRAYLTNETGNQVEELTTINVRATEFATRESMPAVLPPTSAVTYFVNLSVDGAERVSFDKPVTIWTDNFLGFPVGQIVPVGYYNPDKGIWVPQPNGVVVELLDTDGDSVADALDSDGDGEPNDLNSNDLFSDEVEGLKQTQLSGVRDTYMRCEITHFSWVDKNWPFAYPADSIDPNPPGYATVDQKAKEDDNTCIASYIEQKGRILHEDIPIPGTDFDLHYDSSRTAGYLPGVFAIPASGDTVPSSVMWIDVELRIAGKLYSERLDPLPNQTAKIEWDGLDHLGRAVTGAVMADVKIDFVYSATYARPSSRGRAFGQPGTDVMDIDTRIPYPKSLRYSLPVLRGKGSLAEGWTISPHHWVSPVNTSTIFKGDGSISHNNATIIETFAGNGTGGYSGDGAAATEAQINNPYGIRVDASGKVYFADYDNGVVRVVNRDGIITTVPNIGSTTRFAIAPNGNIYYINGYNLWVRYPDGHTERIAGDYHGGYNGEGILAKNARLWPSYVNVDSEGNIYLAEANNHRVRKIDTAGIITTVAGNGVIGHGGDGGPATEARLYYPDSVAVDNSGNIIITENDRVRKVDPTGIITTFAGPGSYDDLGDGGAAVDAYVREPRDLAADASGNVYILEGGGNRVRRVDTTGVITTVAGTGGENGYGGDSGPATGARLWSPRGLALDADGNIYISDNGNDRIRIVSPPAARLAGLMDESDYAFTEESGIGYIMSPAGFHKTTIDLATGNILYEFGYDDNDNLVSVTDVFGNTITIEYSGDVPTAVISPDNIRTELVIDDSSHLTRITYPGGSFYEFEYTPTGLLTVKTEPEGNRFYHGYDEDGRLIDSADEQGGNWTFSREVLDTGEVLHQVVTGEGNVTTYVDFTASTGEFASTITDSTGAASNITQSADGWTENQLLSCGMEQTEIYDIDPEYKFRFIETLIQRTPSGLDRVIQKEMAYQDTNSDAVPDLITEFVSLNNKETRIANNVLQSQNVITSAAGRTITSRYDPATLLVESVSIPGLFDTSYGYDGRGRLTSIVTNARQTVFAYNAQGFLESVTDPENHNTTYSYDPVGRITGISRPDGGYVGFTYDKNGNMTVLTNAVDVDHGFGYNNVNLKSSYTAPLSGSYSYVYDKDRRLIQTNFPSGKTIINDYIDPSDPNDKSRLRQTQTPEGNIDFTYLCGTKVGSITKGSEAIAYGYDGILVTSETLSGTLNHALDYTYNSNFDVSSFAYGGGTVNFVYDNDGLLTGAGSYTITRNAQNGLPEAVTGGALSLARTFNGYAEVDGQDVTVGSQNVTSWALTRDNNGRIIAKTETFDGITANYGYTYDFTGRLQTVTKDGVLVEEYAYDLNGTRNYEMNALREISGRSYSYSDEDHLLSAGTATYSYDLDGFLTTKSDGTDVTVYSYSSRGELLSANLPAGRVIEYVNDPLGRRIAKKVDGVIAEKYLWQGLTRLMAVYDGSDNLLMRFEYADGRMPVAMTAAGVTYYLAYDQIGSLRIIADGTGNVIKRIDYDSFGNIIDDTNPSFSVPFGFAGGLHDRDTGLVRFGYRDYDPEVGRWTAKDPIGFAGGDTDLYGYCLNDTINCTDSSGMISISDMIKGANSALQGYHNMVQAAPQGSDAIQGTAAAARAILTLASELTPTGYTVHGGSIAMEFFGAGYAVYRAHLEFMRQAPNAGPYAAGFYIYGGVGCMGGAAIMAIGASQLDYEIHW